MVDIFFMKTKNPTNNKVRSITDVLLAPKKAPIINPKRPQTNGNRNTVIKYIYLSIKSNCSKVPFTIGTESKPNHLSTTVE